MRFFENTTKHQTMVKVSIFKIKDKKIFLIYYTGADNIFQKGSTGSFSKMT